MHEKKRKIRRLRIISMSAVLGIATIGMIAGLGTGTLSAGGLKKIYAICPLGYLGTAIAGRDLMPGLLICFLIIAGLTILFGRIFCGWVCPIPLERKLLKNKLDEPNRLFHRAKGKDSRERQHGSFETADMKKQAASVDPDEEAVLSAVAADTKKQSSWGMPVLIGALASSAIFKFPVFCLICPIGLTFATLYALIRLFGFKDPTIDLLIFPAIIILELVVLRKWCSKICPLGALLSLFSRLNRRFVPTVDRSRCLETTHGTTCDVCRKACTFDIDVKDGKGSGHISECSKCMECSSSCPVQAIHFPWKKNKKENRTDHVS